MKVKLVVAWYIITSFFLFLYSFTQVDLGLTLSRVSVWQGIQKSFQYVGYFQRPLSTLLFVAILVSFFASYILLLIFASKKLVTKKVAWVSIITTTVILFFSYNAFSYDLFNYIFDAKIFTYYHLNPYAHKALDFAGDPMLGFMHWVERTYPYGPAWLILTIPLSYIGMQIFLITLFLFKALAGAAFLGTVWCIGKISEKLGNKEDMLPILLFGLNPLIIIESLVSAHNDIAMMFFGVAGLLFIMNNKNIRGIFMIIVSIAIKFATIFIIPILLFVFISNILKKKVHWQKMLLSLSLLMIIPVVLASIRTNFQPWYTLFVLPFAAMLGRKYYVIIPFVTFSLFCLLEYVPFLYLGNWNTPVPIILFWLTTSGIIFSIILTSLWKLRIAISLKQAIK